MTQEVQQWPFCAIIHNRRVHYVVWGKIAMINPVRYCHHAIANDLKKKMVFIGGPRQVGKTTFSKVLCESEYKNGEYFNWDVAHDRQAILKQQWKASSPLIIFDELHKYPKWKQWIKGVFDSRSDNQEYMVTGSARLDVYRRGGDSLMGRYHYWRLHPFTLNEIPETMRADEAYDRLLTVGGFPEPFLSGDEREARRWRRERFDRVLREDVRDVENIRHIQLLELFVDNVRTRVGGGIVLANVARDLDISPKTAKAWLMLMEKMYIGFAVYPFTKNLSRAIQKPPKVYFYDNADVITGTNTGAVLENLVATHLLKNLHYLEDYYGYRTELQYIRDKEGREVDFITIVNNEIMDLIEVKLTDTSISPSLKYYAEKLKPKRVIQLVGDIKRGFDKNGIQVRHPIEFFKTGPWEAVS